MVRIAEPARDEQKEKAAIEWENKVLSFLLPIVGLVAFIVGLVGFILVVGQNVGVAVFLIILAALGLGGIAYGVIVFVKKQLKKRYKENKEPDQE